MNDLPPPSDPSFMMSLARGLEVLEAFSVVGPKATAATLAQQTGLSRGVVGRCLHTLEKLGYISASGRLYSPSPRVLRLADIYLSDQGLPAVAQPILERLRDELGESFSLGVLDNDTILYVARASRSQIMTISLRVGSHLPIWCTSMGRVLLAQRSADEIDAYLARAPITPVTDRSVTDPAALRKIFAQVQQQGYSIVDQELEIGLRSIAVPVKDGGGNVVAALNFGANALRITLAELKAVVLPKLVAAAEEIRLSQLGR